MSTKIFAFFLAAAIPLFSACAVKTEETEKPSDINNPEIIELFDDPYVPFYTRDLCEVIESSDTIVIGRVEETLPAELSNSGDEVHTPANIRVIQPFKGDYKTGDVLKIYQLGGVAGGVDFRPVTMYFYKDRETYLFFINSKYGSVLHSEHAINGQTLDGYFFDGKTTDEAASILKNCIENGKLTVDRQQIKSFSFYIDGAGQDDMYCYIERPASKLQEPSEAVSVSPSNTEKWDIEKWNSFISDLDKCGIFDWKRHYTGSDVAEPYWSLEMETDIGNISFQGTNSYPEVWASFLDIIREYTGTGK